MLFKYAGESHLDTYLLFFEAFFSLGVPGITDTWKPTSALKYSIFHKILCWQTVIPVVCSSGSNAQNMLQGPTPITKPINAPYAYIVTPVADL